MNIVFFQCITLLQLILYPHSTGKQRDSFNKSLEICFDINQVLKYSGFFLNVSFITKFSNCYMQSYSQFQLPKKSKLLTSRN